MKTIALALVLCLLSACSVVTPVADRPNTASHTAALSTLPSQRFTVNFNTGPTVQLQWIIPANTSKTFWLYVDYWNDAGFDRTGLSITAWNDGVGPLQVSPVTCFLVPMGTPQTPLFTLSTDPSISAVVLVSNSLGIPFRTTTSVEGTITDGAF